MNITPRASQKNTGENLAGPLILLNFGGFGEFQTKIDANALIGRSYLTNLHFSVIQ